MESPAKIYRYQTLLLNMFFKQFLNRISHFCDFAFSDSKYTLHLRYSMSPNLNLYCLRMCIKNADFRRNKQDGTGTLLSTGTTESIAKRQLDARKKITIIAFYIHKILCICIAQTKQQPALICIYPLRLTFYLHILAAMESVLHATQLECDNDNTKREKQ